MKQLAVYGALALGILVASIAFDNEKTQDIHLTAPYFSGAANYELGRGWLYAESDTLRMTKMPREELESYRIQPSDDLVPYTRQAMGYVFVSWLARNVFFRSGDFKAVEHLQVLVHILITLFFVARFRGRIRKILFFLLYGVNPLTLYVATYPYYYFWQALPSALLLAYLIDPKFRFGVAAIPAVALLAFLHTVRPTMALVSAFFMLLVILREPRRFSIPAAAIAVACGMLFLFTRPDAGINPWHNAYTGIGAYPNPYVAGVEDSRGIDLYEQRYGEKLTFGPGGNSFDREVQARYRALTRESYLEIARKSPFMLVRNAVVNFFQTFSIGYITASVELSYLSSLGGFLYFLLLLLTGRWRFVLAIAAASVTFALYAPPVPVYMYGCYILSIGAFVDLAGDERLLAVVSKRLPFLSARVGSLSSQAS